MQGRAIMQGRAEMQGRAKAQGRGAGQKSKADVQGRSGEQGRAGEQGCRAKCRAGRCQLGRAGMDRLNWQVPLQREHCSMHAS